MRAGKGVEALFVMPPGGLFSRFFQPIGTAFLRAILSDAGVASGQYMPRRNGPLAAFARFLAAARPALVGFTAYETNLRACRAMVRATRQVLPEAVVAVGGPNATFAPEETLELLGADVCLRGAGEGVIAPIAKAVLGSARPSRRLPELLASVPNLVLRTADGTHRTRAGDLSSFPAEHFRSLDDLPSPYQRGLIAAAETGYLTARGCNQHCTYCSFAAISGRKVHFHSVERVLDDLAVLERLARRAKGERSIVPIYDDAFSLAPERARAICEGILQRGLRMRLDCETRAERVDLELLRLMRRAGFETVSFGLESAVPRVLRTIGKVQRPDARGDPAFEGERAWLAAFRRAVQDARRAGLTPSVSVIGGLPGETAQDFGRTLAFVRSLEVESYVHNILAVFPGTPLHRDRERHGLQAWRDASSGLWRTRHRYPVAAVEPLKTSSLRLQRWDEARLLADALCGRPRSRDAYSAGAPWAVVLRGVEPDAALARWLREVLEIHGVLIAIRDARGRGDSELEGWLRTLNDAAVPYGVFALLSRERRAEGGADAFRSRSARGEHLFVFHRQWPEQVRGITSNAAGRFRVPVWIASGAARGPPAAPPRVSLPLPTPQIADGCRWWSGWRRCRRPRVLHVTAGGEVRPCWNGNAIGRVGDSYRSIVRRAEALSASPQDRGGDACPLGSPEDRRAPRGFSPERYEAVAQAAWHFQ